MGGSHVSGSEDIPQSVLAIAEEAYQQAIYMTTSDEPQNMVLMVARAIMAERERCAKLADNRWQDFDAKLASGNIPEHLHERAVDRAFEAQHLASAIRKGTP